MGLPVLRCWLDRRGKTEKLVGVVDINEDGDEIPLLMEIVGILVTVGGRLRMHHQGRIYKMDSPHRTRGG
jgi:hypothetical protein